MAASVFTNANNILIQFNEALRDIFAIVNNESGCSFTQEHVHVVREVTLSLRDYEQRRNLLVVDLQSVINIVQSLLAASTNDTSTETDMKSSDKNSRELLTECIRLLRNACAECSRNQLVVNQYGQLVSYLARVVIRSVTSKDYESINVARCSVQFANNAVIGCADNTALFWNAFFPTFRLILVTSTDAKLKQYTCCLLYNCLTSDREEHSCMLQLVSSETGLQTVSSVIEYLLGTDCEWALFIIEKFLGWEYSTQNLWSLLTDSQRNLLLDITASHLKQNTDENEESCSKLVALSNMLHFADQFSSVCGTLCGLLLNCDETNEQLELSVARQLLECLCLATTSKSSYQKLRDDAKLLSSSLELLKGLHRVGQSGVNVLSIASKPVLDADALSNPLIFGVKSDIIRLLGNLVYKHPVNQNMVRELDGIPLILDHTKIDSNNPFIVQWSVLAVRNLCESNVCNQRLIADLNYQGLAPQTETLNPTTSFAE